jgi:hypothetical protein
VVRKQQKGQEEKEQENSEEQAEEEEEEEEEIRNEQRIGAIVAILWFPSWCPSVRMTRSTAADKQSAIKKRRN